jgi:hypothetical protein
MRWIASFLSLAIVSLVQSSPIITAPLPGEVLQGLVVVTGVTDIAGFVSSELEFAHSNDPTTTWFFIAQSDQPVQYGTLSVWDTTIIADGEYDLRLRIHLSNGSHLDVMVPGLQVRNYSFIESPSTVYAIIVETATKPVVSPSLPMPTSSPLSPNSAALTPSRIFTGFVYGALAAIALLLLLHIYIRLRRN